MDVKKTKARALEPGEHCLRCFFPTVLILRNVFSSVNSRECRHRSTAGHLILTSHWPWRGARRQKEAKVRRIWPKYCLSSTTSSSSCSCFMFGLSLVLTLVIEGNDRTQWFERSIKLPMVGGGGVHFDNDQQRAWVEPSNSVTNCNKAE